jgi:hypothetical protein
MFIEDLGNKKQAPLGATRPCLNVPLLTELIILIDRFPEIFRPQRDEAGFTSAESSK